MNATATHQNKTIPLDRWLTQRKALRRALSLLALIIISGFVLGWWGGDQAGASTWMHWRGVELKLTRVVDGRTLELQRADQSPGMLVVRLLGIAPEAETDPDCASWLREVCAGEGLRLSFPKHPLPDQRGRWGAFVYLASGAMLNETALEKGHARRETLEFDPELNNWFQRLENRAKFANLGRWDQPQQ